MNCIVIPLEMYAAKCNHFGYTSKNNLFLPYKPYTKYRLFSCTKPHHLMYFQVTHACKAFNFLFILYPRPFPHTWICPNLVPCGPDWYPDLGVTNPWLHLKEAEDILRLSSPISSVFRVS